MQRTELLHYRSKQKPAACRTTMRLESQLVSLVDTRQARQVSTTYFNLLTAGVWCAQLFGSTVANRVGSPQR